MRIVRPTVEPRKPIQALVNDGCGASAPVTRRSQSVSYTQRSSALEPCVCLRDLTGLSRAAKSLRRFALVASGSWRLRPKKDAE
jgi:hypothetical protein